MRHEPFPKHRRQDADNSSRRNYARPTFTVRHWCTMMYRFRRQAGLQHVGRGSIESTRAVVAMHPELVQPST
jgi:hypothetical protein